MSTFESDIGFWKEFNNYEFNPEDILNKRCYHCNESAEGIGNISKINEDTSTLLVSEYFCTTCAFILLDVHENNPEKAIHERKIFWLREFMTRK